MVKTMVTKNGRPRMFRVWRFSCIIAALWCAGASGQATLLIYLQGGKNSHNVQRRFDRLIGAGKAIVFERINNFDSALAHSPDAAVIALEPFFSFSPGYKIVLSGKKGSATSEKYHIVAVNKEITMHTIGEKKVGIVDFLGKNRLQLFIKDQFGIEIKMLKRANTGDDLLTMLGMEVVDAIIVSESQHKEILSNTKTPLIIVASSLKKIGFAAYGIREGKENRNQRQKVQKAPTELLKEIGIEGWELR